MSVSRDTMAARIDARLGDRLKPVDLSRDMLSYSVEAADLSDAVDFTIDDNASLTVAGNATFDGGLSIANGTLTLNGNSTIDTAAASSIAIAPTVSCLLAPSRLSTDMRGESTIITPARPRKTAPSR